MIDSVRREIAATTPGTVRHLASRCGAAEDLLGQGPLTAERAMVLLVALFLCDVAQAVQQALNPQFSQDKDYEFDPCSGMYRAKVIKDPHIDLAHGGRADFRGGNNTLYNFLSTPGLSVNVRMEEALYSLHDGKLLVNGTYMTEVQELRPGLRRDHVQERLYGGSRQLFYAAGNSTVCAVRSHFCIHKLLRTHKGGGAKEGRNPLATPRLPTSGVLTGTALATGTAQELRH